MIKELVLFGVTGDLAKQKLIPALFNLYRNGEISRKSSFIGFGRKKFTKVDFQNFIEETLQKNMQGLGSVKNTASIIREFSSQWSYIESELDQVAGYTKLKSSLHTDNTVVYLSLPPAFQRPVSEYLLDTGILTKANQRKLAIEKPYGFDAVSSLRLDTLLTRKLRVDQILRVDHYAGKQALVELEQVAHQGIFENILSSKIFNRIQVNFIESVDASMRGSFYDAVGALNDVCQNHVLHMLATILTLPEVKIKNNLSLLRAESLSCVSLSRPPKNPILAQYEGFNATAGVSINTSTETFFRVYAEVKKGNKLFSKRWGGLQIELIGGKALSESNSSILLYSTNKKVQPLKIMVNGYGTRDAYEQIFIDAFYYNKDRFIDFEQIQRSWEIVEKIKKIAHANLKKVTASKSRASSGVKILQYKKGSYPQDISYKS
jgi:glucose-6-phosphate 1-dehydrogenase